MGPTSADQQESATHPPHNQSSAESTTKALSSAKFYPLYLEGLFLINETTEEHMSHEAAKVEGSIRNQLIQIFRMQVDFCKLNSSERSPSVRLRTTGSIVFL